MTRRPYHVRRAPWQLHELENRLAPSGTSGISDATGTTEIITFPPAASDDLADTDGTNPVSVDILGNDAAAQGRTLDPTSVAVTTPPAHGTVGIDPQSGDVTYTGTGFFMGTDTFRYTVKDDTGAVSNPATVSIVIHRPTANDDFAQTAKGVAVTVPVLANDTDPDGNDQIDTTSVRVVSQPSHGAVSVNHATGDVTYVPAPSFVGTDTFRYTVTDKPGAESAPGTVTIVVEPPATPPPAPTANDDIADTDGTNPVTVPVLANDTAAPGDKLDPTTVTVTTGPQHGTVSVDAKTGDVTYTGTGFFMGTDTFQYTVKDAAGAASNAATVSIVIHRPTANDDFTDTDGNNPVTIPVLANDTDPDGNDQIDATSVRVVSQPAHGTVSVDSKTGDVTYTAIGDFTGTDTFQYTVSDKPGAVSAPGTVTVRVNRPTARDDRAVTFGSTPAQIDVLANDSDPDGDDQIDKSSVQVVTGPAHGTAAVDPTTGQIVYTPGGSFIGTDTFTYTVTDFPGAVSNPATVRVHVGVAAAQQFTAVGADAGGGPRVTLYNPDGSVRANLFAFEPSFTGGVRVAVADVNGDGTPDVIAGAGVGGGPRITVFSGTDLSVIANFFPFDPSFRGGVYVAAGDVEGTGRADVIAGAGVGGGPRITVFRASGTAVADFFAFDPSFRGGVNVAAGDIGGNGPADIVATPGQGGGPRVQVFGGTGLPLVADFFAFDSSFRGGASVAVGDTNGDGRADVIAAAGPGGGPRVQVFSGSDFAPIASFFAYDASVTSGVRVAAADLEQSGRADVLTAVMAGSPQPVRAFDAVSGRQIETVSALGDFNGGIYVGGAG